MWKSDSIEKVVMIEYGQQVENNFLGYLEIESNIYSHTLDVGLYKVYNLKYGTILLWMQVDFVGVFGA